MVIIADVKEGAIGEDCGGWKRGAGWLRSCGKEFNGKVWFCAEKYGTVWQIVQWKSMAPCSSEEIQGRSGLD